MADWNWHIALAKELLNYISVDNKYDFLLGSIIPDIPWVDPNEDSPVRTKVHLMKSRTKSFGSYADLNTWLDIHTENVRQYDLFKGALTHIILDNEVNTVTGMLVTVDSLGRCTVYGKEPKYPHIITADEVLQEKWGNLEKFSLERFGVQRDWLTEKSSWISHTASDILASYFEMPKNLQDDIPLAISKRLPEVHRITRCPEILSEDILSSIHDACKAKCLRYLTLLKE